MINGIVYKLCCKNPEIKEIYVGSTKNLYERRRKHKEHSYGLSKSKQSMYYVYTYIRENGGWDNWDIIVIEKYNCEEKHELKYRERYWLETLNAKLNSKSPIKSKEELKVSSQVKINCECGGKYTHGHTSSHLTSEIHQKWVNDNITKNDNAENVCECGGIYQNKHKNEHMETLKHLTYLGLEDEFQPRQPIKYDKHNCECGGKYTTSHKTEHEKSKKHLTYLATLS